jgi:Protein of unknown function, DUF481
MCRTTILMIFTALVAVSALAEDPPPAKEWSSSIGAGLAITSGNTDTKNYNLAFATKYDPKTRFVFKADALYLRGDSNGVTQVDKASLDARGEYSLSDRTFAFVEVSYLRDPFKDVTYFVDRHLEDARLRRRLLPLRRRPDHDSGHPPRAEAGLCLRLQNEADLGDREEGRQRVVRGAAGEVLGRLNVGRTLSPTGACAVGYDKRLSITGVPSTELNVGRTLSPTGAREIGN